MRAHQRSFTFVLVLVAAGCAPAMPLAFPDASFSLGAYDFQDVDVAVDSQSLETRTTNNVLVQYREGVTRAPAHGIDHSLPYLDGVHVVEVASQSERDALMAEISADPDVVSSTPETVVGLDWAPNDPLLARQWDLPRIDVPAAWDRTHGDPSVVVAVLDTGADGSHPDLQNQLVPGFSFINNSPDTADGNGHGTHCAGTIAARADNAIGVAGIAPGCKVMPVQVMNPSGSGVSTAIIQGINYAVAHGAKVISMSLGGTTADPLEKAAVGKAVAAGVLVVAAAGNNGSSSPIYPAAFGAVVAVGATDPHDARASFSNFGSWVTIAAPGTDITNTVPVARGSYGTMQGTSMACPHVAGVAALVRSLHPCWNVKTVREALEDTGAPTTGFMGNAALKRVDAMAALGFGGDCDSPAPVPTAKATPRPAATATPRPAAPTPAPTPRSSTTPLPTAVKGAPLVTRLTAKVKNPYSIAVSWNTDQSASGLVAYGTAPSALLRTSARQAGLATGHSVLLTGLKPNTRYYLQVRATNAAGATGASQTLSVQTQNLVVTHLSISGMTATAAPCTWTTNVATKGSIWFGTSQGGLTGKTPESALSTGHTTTLSGLRARTLYYIQVHAADASGNTALGPIWSFTTP